MAASGAITPVITKAVEKAVNEAIGSGITGVLRERAIDSDVIFSHSRGSGQFALFFPLGAKLGRLSRVCAHIRSLVNKRRTIKIQNALSISGRGVPFNEDLKSLGVIGFEDGTAFVDVETLYSKVESSIAYISLVQKFQKTLIKDMVITHMSQNWRPKNGKKLFFMEVIKTSKAMEKILPINQHKRHSFYS